MNEEPCYEKEYLKGNGYYDPFLDIIIGNNKFTLYADTGCNSGISISNEQAKKLDLGEKITQEPIDVKVADGHIISADIYILPIELNGLKRDVEICVIYPEIKDFKPEEIPPLLGRDFLDHFDVLFKGKDRKIQFFEPK